MSWLPRGRRCGQGKRPVPPVDAVRAMSVRQFDILELRSQLRYLARGLAAATAIVISKPKAILSSAASAPNPRGQPGASVSRTFYASDPDVRISRPSYVRVGKKQVGNYRHCGSCNQQAP